MGQTYLFKIMHLKLDQLTTVTFLKASKHKENFAMDLKQEEHQD